MNYKLPEAFLVDMDGTMLDTEKYWMSAEEEVVAKYGKELSHELALEFVGTDIAVSAQIMIDRLGIEGVSVQELVDQISTKVNEKFRSEPLPWREGAVELIKFANKNGVPIALVTSSYSTMAGIFTEEAKKVDGTGFRFFVAGDQVDRLKPDPQPYQMAAQRLGVNIENCIIIEDSNAGTQAAIASKAHVIAIPFMTALKDYKGISWLNSINELTPELIDRILDGENVNLIN